MDDREKAIIFLRVARGCSGEEPESQEFARDYAEACAKPVRPASPQEFWARYPDWEPDAYIRFSIGGSEVTIPQCCPDPTPAFTTRRLMSNTGEDYDLTIYCESCDTELGTAAIRLDDSIFEQHYGGDGVFADNH